MFLRQPLLYILRPLPLSFSQPLLKFVQRRALQPRRRTAPMLSFQQLSNASFLQCCQPVKELPTADLQLLGYLRSCELSACYHAHGQQSLMVSDVLACIQCRHHCLGQSRTIQTHSFWHALIPIIPIEIVQLRTADGIKRDAHVGDENFEMVLIGFSLLFLRKPPPVRRRRLSDVRGSRERLCGRYQAGSLRLSMADLAPKKR